MDTLKSLTEKINKKTSKKPVFYITNDPERALGLENILKNYHIICLDDNQMVDYMKTNNVNIFSLEKVIGKKNSVFRNSNRILKNKLTQKYIEKHSQDGAYAIFFKIASNLERSCEKYNLKPLNTKSKLNRKYELKISQYKTLSRKNVNFPKTVITKLKDTSYTNLEKKLNKKFIIQFNRGHTGEGTQIIESKKQFKKLQEKFPKRQIRAARKITGDAYTLNACVTKHGIALGGLSYQLTGYKEATALKNATVGNDFDYPRYLSKEVIIKIEKLIQTIGTEIRDNGYKGLFGVDLIIEKGSQKVFTIEINARQPASIPFYTKLQINHDQIPLSMLHIAEFLDIDYKIHIEKYNKQAIKPIEAAQIFIRNKHTSKKTIDATIKNGIYRLQSDNSAYNWSKGKPTMKDNVIFLSESKDLPLIFKQEAYSLEEVGKGGMLILAKEKKAKIKPNSEIGRLQINDTLINKNKKLKPWVKNVINGLREYITFKLD